MLESLSAARSATRASTETSRPLASARWHVRRGARRRSAAHRHWRSTELSETARRRERYQACAHRVRQHTHLASVTHMPRACLRLSLVTLDARTLVAVRCSAMQAPNEWTEAARIAHHTQSFRTQPRETHLSHATSSHATPSHATSPHATSSHATPAHATSSHARHASSREPASHEQALLPRHEARRSEEGSDSIHPASRVCHWRPVPHTHARRARRGRILSTPRAASATGGRSLTSTQEERREPRCRHALLLWREQQ